MKRTTISLPNDIAMLLEREARRREISISEVTRQVLAEHFGLASQKPRELPFKALGASGHHDTAERIEEILAEELGVLAIVDAGPLYAAVDTDDRHHAESVAVLERPDLQLVIPALVVTEVCYMLGRRLGPRAEAGFLRGLEQFDVEAPRTGDWERIGHLVAQYADFPLGGVDASVIALAERLRTEVVLTLDRRHFGAVRPIHCPAFALLPA